MDDMSDVIKTLGMDNGSSLLNLNESINYKWSQADGWIGVSIPLVAPKWLNSLYVKVVAFI